MNLGLTGWISLVGLIIGVACLVVAMAVVSGFELTLQKTVSDVTGHLQILKLSGMKDGDSKLDEALLEQGENVLGKVSVLWVEAVAAHRGRITGALVQGVKSYEVQGVLGYTDRILEGEFNVATREGLPQAVIGKALAKRFELKVGDSFQIVIPLASDLDPNQFRRKLGKFLIAGILDLGKYEYDERLIVVDETVLRELAEVGDKSSGVLVRISDPQGAPQLGSKISQSLGPGYRVRDWRTMNSNMLDAIDIERYVIFFVILIIVFAAAFNVSSALYLSVVQRYPEIGILKAMGLGSKSILRVFSWQGLILGFWGCIGGFMLGLLLCGLFWFGQRTFDLLPGSVYKLDRIEIVLRWSDLALIFGSTLVICFLATLAPAIRGARLSAVEGLRYE